MSSTVLNRVNDVEPSLVLFGRDPAGKPRASWFDAASIDFAMSAAELMQMKILHVVTEQQRAIAKQLARGWIFSSGRAFAPFARAKVYQQLLDGERQATHGAIRGRGNRRRSEHGGRDVPGGRPGRKWRECKRRQKARRPAVLPLVAPACGSVCRCTLLLTVPT